MRMMFAGALALTLCATAASAATPPDLCKDGQIAVVRFSAVKPGAKAQYDKAGKGQGQWYRSHGFTQNRLLFGDILVQDPKTKDWSVSTAEAFSLHMNTPGPASNDKRDAAYDAFVADYRASSDITTEKLVCLREPVK